MAYRCAHAAEATVNLAREWVDVDEMSRAFTAQTAWARSSVDIITGP